MMDLSKLSDEDFQALQSGDLRRMSEAGFAQFLVANENATPPEARRERAVRQAREQNNPTIGMSGPQKFAAGMGKAITDVGRAIHQAMPGSSMTRERVDEIRQLDAPLMATGAGRAGFVTGTAATAAPFMLAPGANTVVGAGAYGALSGALTPVGTDDSVLTNAAWGAGGGMLGAGIANAGSRVLQPQPQAGVRTVTQAGVTLTPGQRLGGAWKRAEDAMTSLPVTGDSIRNAQRRSIEEFNAAVANRALAPINGQLPPGVVGRDAIAYTESALGRAYDSVLNRIGTVRSDVAFGNELQSLRQMVNNGTMPREVKKQFNTVIQNQVLGKFQGQRAMTAQTFKDVESELGRLAVRYQGDASVDKQLLGDALQEAQEIMRKLLERSAGPQYAADVKAANTGWAEFKRMQRAASMLGAKDGVFSPENYLNAIKAMDRSKDKGAFARGTALGQDFGSDAARVMGNTVPDSGTPFRTLMTSPVSGSVTAATTLPVMGLYGSPKLQRLAQMLMSPNRPALATRAAAELQMAAPALSALGISGANAYERTNQK